MRGKVRESCFCSSRPLLAGPNSIQAPLNLFCMYFLVLCRNKGLLRRRSSRVQSCKYALRSSRCVEPSVTNEAEANYTFLAAFNVVSCSVHALKARMHVVCSSLHRLVLQQARLYSCFSSNAPAKSSMPPFSAAMQGRSYHRYLREHRATLPAR